MTGVEARLYVDRSVRNLDDVIKLAYSDNINAYIAKSSLEILNGAKSNLLYVYKKIPDGVLPLGVATITGEVSNAIKRADVAIRTVRDYGLKSNAQLGISLSTEFGNAIRELPKTLANAATSVAATAAKVVEKVADTAGSVLGGVLKGLLPILVPLLVIVGVLLYLKTKGKL